LYKSQSTSPGWLAEESKNSVDLLVPYNLELLAALIGSPRFRGTRIRESHRQGLSRERAETVNK